MFKRLSGKSKTCLIALVTVSILALGVVGVVQAVFANLKLSGTMIAEGDVQFFKLSPDGAHVVFRADAREAALYELFSVPVLGGSHTRLSVDFPTGCRVTNFFITPNSQTVVYYLTSACNTNCGLYAVPIDGGPSTLLFEPEVALSTFTISPDGQHIFFIVSYHVFEQIIGKSIADPDLPVWHTDYEEVIYDYDVTPDSQSVVYLKKLSPENVYLFRGDLDGDDMYLDNGEIEDFKITPDGQHVIFRKSISGGYDLFEVPIGGGIPMKMNNDLDTNASVYAYDVTPNSEYVVYLSDELAFGTKLLFRSSVNSSEPILLLTHWGMAGNVSSFKIMPAGWGVVYKADQLVLGRRDLFAVLLDGSAYQRLNTGMIDAGNIRDYEIIPNNWGVVFIADYFTDQDNELFAVLINGSWGVKLNSDLIAGGDVINFKILDNSQAVVYYADQDEDNVFNLYVVPTAGGMPPVQVNPNLVRGGAVRDYYLTTPDNKGVIYLADQEEHNQIELFITYDFKPPTDIILSNDTVAEKEPIYTVVGTFSTSDVDIGDSFNYGLVPGSGDEDNGSFNIFEDQLITSQVFDYETKSSYSIRVRSTDKGGLSVEKMFTILVLEVSEDNVIFLPLVVR